MIVVRWTRATHLVGDDGERIRQPGWTAILLMPGDGGLAVDDPPRQHCWSSWQAAVDLQALNEGVRRQFEIDTAGLGRRLVGAVRTPWRASDAEQQLPSGI